MSSTTLASEVNRPKDVLLGSDTNFDISSTSVIYSPFFNLSLIVPVDWSRFIGLVFPPAFLQPSADFHSVLRSVVGSSCLNSMIACSHLLSWDWVRLTRTLDILLVCDRHRGSGFILSCESLSYSSNIHCRSPSDCFYLCECVSSPGNPTSNLVLEVFCECVLL